MSLEKWAQFNPSYKYIQRNSELLKILDFYIWNCPVKGIVPHAKTFNDYNINKPYEFKKLKKELRFYQNVEIKYLAPSRADMLDTLKKEKQYNHKRFTEVIILLKGASGLEDLFRCIRNAFAHGTFYMEKEKGREDYFFFLENRNKSLEINARIVLRSSTLIRWINILKTNKRDK